MNERSVVNKRRPLIVVPGLFGSKIEVKKGKRWKRAWPGLMLCHLERLAMTGAGEPVYPSRVTGITGETLGIFGYGPLLKALEKVWSKKDNTLVEAPYDWRCDLKKTAALEGEVSGVPSLASRIKQVLNPKAGIDKVDIICHSQGGLAVMHYLAEDPNRFAHVHRCLFLAPGFFGSVVAAKRIIYGTSLRPSASKFELARPKWKRLSHNMTGVYQLFPSHPLTHHLNGFLEINGEHQDFKQSYALAHSKQSITLDQVINISLLQSAGELRYWLDKTMLDEPFLRKFQTCAYIFYGVIPDSTDGRLSLTYPGRKGVPKTKEHKTAGDENVIDCCWHLFGLAKDRVRAFPCKTHMDMVQCSDVLDAAISVLCG